jgi:hypothetical protein
MTGNTQPVSVKTRGGTGLLVAAVAVSLLSSCSFAMRSLPSDWQPHQPPRCTKSTVAPVIDTTAAVPLTLFGPVLGVLSLAALRSCEDEGCMGPGLGLLFGIPITLIDIFYVTAAVRGFHKANQCSEAHKAHQRALQLDTAKP